MSLTVGLGGEGKAAEAALERPLAVMGSEVSYQGALISTGVGALAALVGGQAKMGALMDCKIKCVID